MEQQVKEQKREIKIRFNHDLGGFWQVLLIKELDECVGKQTIVLKNVLTLQAARMEAHELRSVAFKGQQQLIELDIASLANE